MAGATGYDVCIRTELLMCVFGICYYSASSPIRAKESVLATADYWHLPPFGQERPATLRVFGTELLLCLFGLLLQRLFPS